jgi:hypothetical protein
MAKAVVKKKFGGAQEGAGRPLKEINADQVYRLALIHCTIPEIASTLCCAPSTIKDRFSADLHRGHEEGQMSLKRKMHEVAMNGDTKMLIWLSKQRLGYKDVMPEEATQVNFNVYTTEVPK